MALPQEKSYTYADLLEWNDGKRYELYNGQPVMMSPPLRQHQEISGEIYLQIGTYLKGKKCKVYHAPFSVRPFAADGDSPYDTDTLVEPDITVVCSSDKLDKYGCKGAPDLTLEVLSPSSTRHDLLVKLNLYQRAGVREYWVVSPEDKTVNVFLLDGDGLKLSYVYGLKLSYVYGPKDIAKVNGLDGCFIELSKVFPA